MNRFEYWSRRKRGLDGDRQASQADTAVPADKMPLADAATEVETEGEESLSPGIAEPEPGTESGAEAGSLDDQLPDPDTLEPGSDFKPFLLPGVSPELKRRALRRMFSASSYNVRDGLDDYDQDYSKMPMLSKQVADQLRHWSDKLSADQDAALSEEEVPPASPREYAKEDDESGTDRQTAEHSPSGDMSQPDTRLGQTDTSAS